MLAEVESAPAAPPPAPAAPPPAPAAPEPSTGVGKKSKKLSPACWTSPPPDPLSRRLRRATSIPCCRALVSDSICRRAGPRQRRPLSRRGRSPPRRRPHRRRRPKHPPRRRSSRRRSPRRPPEAVRGRSPAGRGRQRAGGAQRARQRAAAAAPVPRRRPATGRQSRCGQPEELLKEVTASAADKSRTGSGEFKRRGSRFLQAR